MAVYRSVRNLDWVLILVALAIAALGVLQIYSATLDTAWRSAWWKQLLFVAAGLLVMWIMTRIDYHTILGQVPVLYAVSIGLLVLTPLAGSLVWGSRRWIPIGLGFKFQPSEFVKLVIVLLVARYLAELKSDRLEIRDLVKLGLFVAIPCGLVAAQPDLGTSLTYVRGPKGRYEYSDDESVITFHLESDPVEKGQKGSNDPNAGRCQMIRATHRPGRERDWHRAYFDAATVPIRLPSVEDLRLLPRKDKFLPTSDVILQLRNREAEMKKDNGLLLDASGLTPGEAAVRKKQLLQRQDEARGWLSTIHRRSALSLAPLLLAAAAIPIAVMIGRGHQAVAFGIAIAMVVGYYAVMAMGWRLGRFGLVSPEAGIWGATAATAVCGLVLLRRMLRQ